MKEIKLADGCPYTAKVDDCDFDWLNKFEWFGAVATDPDTGETTIYACTESGEDGVWIEMREMIKQHCGIQSTSLH